MYSNKCLFWEHGTLLQPQHLQIATLQASALPLLFSNTLCPYSYGVLKLGFREEALLLQSVELHTLDALLPTGEHLVLGDNTVIEPRRFDAAWTNPEAPLQVWLGLTPLSSSGNNVTEADTPAPSTTTRFVASYTPDVVPDLYGTGPRADVRFMRYNARILFGTEKDALDTLHVLPLGLLERDGDVVRFAPAYAPPCLDMHASPLLLEQLRGIRNSVVARAGHLEDYKLLPDPTANAQGARVSIPITTQSLAMYTMHGILARYAPLLDHLCESPSLHPWPVYGVVRQLVGELSTFSAELDPLGESTRGERLLPPYDHHNLGPCFAAARLIVTRIVDSLVMGPAYSFNLEFQGDHFGGHLPGHACGNAYRYWLLVRDAALPAGNDVARRAKLAPAALLHNLVSRSLPGIRLIPVDQPPAGLPKRTDTLYLAIDQTDSLWESIMTTGDPALFLPDVSTNTVVQLALMQY